MPETAMLELEDPPVKTAKKRTKQGVKVQVKRKSLSIKDPGGDLPILIYLEMDKSDAGTSEATQDVVTAVIKLLGTYGLEVGEREDITGSVIVKLRAFLGMSVEPELRLDWLSYVTKGGAGRKEITEEREHALARLNSVLQKYQPTITLGSIIVTTALAIASAVQAPRNTEQKPHYVWILEKDKIVLAEVDAGYSDKIHSGEVTIPQLKIELHEASKER